MNDTKDSVIGKYQVEQIDSLDQFEKIKIYWEKVYQADSHAQVFLSWTWLKSWFSSMSFQWFILCFKDKSGYVAFLPLTILATEKYGFKPIRRLNMAGQPFAAYTGFLCLPEAESNIFPLMAQYVQEDLKWDVFNMQWVRDPRLELFLSHFPESKFSTKLSDGLPSLFVNLPDTYDDYLQGHLGKKFRKTLNGRLKHIDNNTKYTFTIADDNSIDADIENLVSLWKNRWGQRVDAIWYNKILHYHYENKLLRVFTLKCNGKPVSVLACILDPVKNTVVAYVTSYDPVFSKISPGIVIFADAIKQAIGDGYKIFDFTVGLDRYKISMGAKKQSTNNVIIERKALRSRIPIESLKLAKKIARAPKKFF